MRKRSRFQRGILAVVVLALGACASVPDDLGRSEVDEMVAARGRVADEAGSPEATQELLAKLTDAPLTADSAIRIALINNPRLKATYATLGFAAADVYEASRIRNPVFSAAFMESNVAGEQNQLTLGLAVSFADLITLPARKRLSASVFAAFKQSVGAEVLAAAAHTEKAYFQYIGAKQVSALREQIAKAAALSAALAARFHDAGNLSARDLALERAAASEAQLSALETEADTFAARTVLAASLGLSVGGSWDAPAQLGMPLESDDPLDELLKLAHQSRLDLAAARIRADLLADQLGVVSWSRWLGDLNVGVEREDETDGGRLTGPTLELEVPIFNQHQDAMLRANADLQIALADVMQISTEVDNDVRLAFATLDNAKARVKEFRNVLLPQRIEAVARGQEEVNFMLIGIFELISMKQDEYDAYQGYLEAIRDYWVARTELSLAAGTALPSNSRIGEERIDVNDFIRPAPSEMDHSGHDAKPSGDDRMNSGETGAEPMDHSMHDMKNDKPVAPEPMDHSGHSMTEGDNARETTHGMHSHPDDGETQ